MNTRISRLIATCVALAVFFAFSSSCYRTTQPPSSVPTLRILCLFPLTGPGASLGEYIRNGAELAREEANRRYQGRLNIELEIVDSKSQPREAVSALQAAISRNRPDAVITGLSAVSRAIVPIVEQENIPTIVTTTALTDLPKGTRNVVRVYPTSEDFVEPVAQNMARRFDRVAILYVNDDYGLSNQRIFNSIMQGAGKQVISSEAYELTQMDSRGVIQRVLSTSPQAVFVTGYGPAFINVFKQLREINRDVPIFSEISFATPSVLNALGVDANGIVFDGTEMELSQPTLQSVIEFRTAYQSRFNAVPYQVAGFSHDAVIILAEAALRNGTSAKPSKRTIISLSPFQGVMSPIRFDAEGESRITLQLMKREGGTTILMNE